MSARITISYETEQELRELTNILSPVMKNARFQNKITEDTGKRILN